jgi:DNA-binding NtrC family response regulator
MLFSLEGLLRRDFTVHAAEGGVQALDILNTQPVHVIVTDQRMPGMTGAEFLRRAQEIRPDAVPILLTGYADIRAVIDAVNHGHLFRYLTKPCDPDDLIATIAEAAERYARRTDHRRLLADARMFIEQAASALPEGDWPRRARALTERLSAISDNI